MVTDLQLAYATIAEITDKTGPTRYRHLPPRPAEALAAETSQPRRGHRRGRRTMAENYSSDSGRRATPWHRQPVSDA
jgi:hypothetical protein